MIKKILNLLPRISFFLFVVVAVLPIQDLKAQICRTKTGSIVPQKNLAYWADSMTNNAPDKPVRVLLHFSAMPTAIQKAQLSANGILLQEYLPEKTWEALIKHPLNLSSINTESFGLTGITNIPPVWKIERTLAQRLRNNNSEADINVLFDKCVADVEIRNTINALGGEIAGTAFGKMGMYRVKIGAGNVQALASFYGVKYITEYRKPIPCDLQARPTVHSNAANTMSYFSGPMGLDGDGVTVGVGDEGSAIYHADENDRVVNFCPFPIAHHGEHVNGIVGGAGNIDPYALGMAPKVQLLDFLFDFYFPEYGPMFNDYKMTITNNSYSVSEADCNYAGTYDVYAYLMDSLALQFPYINTLFASGNDGAMSCSNFPSGFATVEGGYQPAKNIITVGSIQDNLLQAFDESRGPVKDGRLKPDIVAVGRGQVSTIGVDQYEWAAGTSMASPQVAGGMAIITQRYEQLYNDSIPHSDLLKAILLAGALDVGNPGPDYTFGFGAMDVNRSLIILDSGNYFRSVSHTGGNQEYSINVPPNTAQLKVLICWNDPPASLFAATQLVNDIDLTVTEPTGTIHFPLYPDTTTANVDNPSFEHPDHINNVEQVVINNPAAGSYNVKIHGYSIPAGPQPYGMAYDIIPRGILPTFPLGGEQFTKMSLLGLDSIRVFWDGVNDGNGYSVYFSPDSGTTWNMLSSNIAPGSNVFDFRPDSLNSPFCRTRICHNNTTDTFTSGNFTINIQPVITLDTAQCPGYIGVHWSPVTNASSYYLLSKTGYYMQVVDSTTDTSYVFRNMSLNNKSYVAVQPVFGKIPGFRSIALFIIANYGTCTNPVCQGDLMLQQILAPKSGRQYTSSALTANDTLVLKVRNLYNAPCAAFSIAYALDSLPWIAQPMITTIPPDSFLIVKVPGLDLSDTGFHKIIVSVNNNSVTDPNPWNDTLSIVFWNIPNDTLPSTRTFADSFETMAAFSISNDSIGISRNGHWDYLNANDSGRLRTFVSDDVTFSGRRAISLDENQATVTNNSHNQLVGTFNLSNFDTGLSELRMDFDYMVHGVPKSPVGNIVNIRSADTAAWSSFFHYNLTGYPGLINHAQSLSVTDAFRALHTNFTSSTQVSFGQNDTAMIAGPNIGNGITIDNFRLYAVNKDIQMLRIVTPLPINCGMPSGAQLMVQLRNGMNYTLYGISVYYQLDNGTVYSDIIDSIAPKDTLIYTCHHPLNLSTGNIHSINAWAVEPGDSYTGNDSIMNYIFRDSRIVDSFPYLENFESGDGGYFTQGYNDSWQYGRPHSVYISNAATGTKAWKTNLNGNYNNYEQSYLYSPCFDLSSLTNPMLSFSAALDIEDCGTSLCDLAYVEYSTDGISWSRLGNYREGTNWYDSALNGWHDQGFTRWHVASIPLPKPAGGSLFFFRFVLLTDADMTGEGIAIDDIHIFDKKYPIRMPMANEAVSDPAYPNSWIDIIWNDSELAAINAVNQNFGDVTASVHPHTTLANASKSQCIFTRSYVFLPAANGDSVGGLRLYITDSEFVAALNDTTCPSCTRPPDVYRLGVTEYQDSNAYHLNGSLSDDTTGVFSYLPYSEVKWVPYDNGYYAEISAPLQAEFWFNDGGPTRNFAVGKDYLEFNALRSGASVKTNWFSGIDTAIAQYFLNKSLDNYHYALALDTPSANMNPDGNYYFTDDTAFNTSDTIYYLLQWIMKGNNNKIYNSVAKRACITDSTDQGITFDAVQNNHRQVLLSWNSGIDAMVASYVLQRSIGDNAFTTLENPASQKLYTASYQYTDYPLNAGAIKNHTVIHYRLTAILTDGTQIVLPEKTIVWINNNSLVSLYPNPVKDGVLTLNYDADPGTAVSMVITDIVGQQVFETHFTATSFSNSEAIHTFRKPAGLYFVHIRIGNSDFVVKMEWM